MYLWRSLTPEERSELIAARRQRGFPPHSPPHPQREESYFLLTAACYEHNQVMRRAARRQQALDALLDRFIGAGFETRAWVVLPNHYHLLAWVPDLAQVGPLLGRIHGSLSHQWNLEDNTPSRQVWYRFTDRAIRSEGHYYTTLNYVHYNPCKHRCAKTPYDWPQSSVGWYLEHYGRDWLRDLWRTYPVREYGRGWDEDSAAQNAR